VTPISTRSSGRATRPQATIPYRHIACCVDGDPVSITAADEAARLRSFAPGRLTFLHASEALPVIGAFPAGMALPFVEDEATRKRLATWIHEIARTRSGQGELLDGYPPRAIVDWITDNGADLVIAGAHRGAGERFLLGGFATYLAGHSPCSVLVVRPGSTTAMSRGVPYRHIAVCVDDSEPSRRALQEARLLAAAGADTLSIVHVAHWPMSHIVMGYAEVPDPTDTFVRAEQWLRDQAGKVDEATAVFLTGYPPAAVCDWAHETAPDLIVAASHRGRLDRFLLGSFARYVAYHAPCEVLLTRAPVRQP
jgi:nucleotide-binding universal stress UspA family protein